MYVTAALLFTGMLVFPPEKEKQEILLKLKSRMRQRDARNSMSSDSSGSVLASYDISANKATHLSPPKSRFATAVLLRGHRGNLIKYNESVVQRNIAIARQDWSPVVDHLVFYDDAMPKADREYIQAQTSLSLRFIDVEAFFAVGREEHERRNAKGGYDKRCNPTGLAKRFSAGYKAMCHFWYSGFLQFTRDYDTILRVDDDVVFSGVCDIGIPPRPGQRQEFLASTSERSPYDVSAGITRGMRSILAEVGFKHGFLKKLPPDGKFSWPYSPTTQMMLLNATRLRSDHRIVASMAAIDATGCQYSNRWGDMPLWGGSANLFQLPIARFRTCDYTHGSNNQSFASQCRGHQRCIPQ